MNINRRSWNWLWDKYNLKCDVLFKVNINYSNELEPIFVEIPEIIKENKNILNNYLIIKTNFNEIKYLKKI